MAFTYALSTNIGRVRLLLSDVDQGTAVFTDAEIQAFLDIEGDQVKLAAAQAIDANASNEALASKVLRTQDLTTDGAKLADALRAHARNLRDQHDAELDREDAGYFGVVEEPGDGFWGPEHTNRAWY